MSQATASPPKATSTLALAPAATAVMVAVPPVAPPMSDAPSSKPPSVTPNATELVSVSRSTSAPSVVE
jgi:hypothetical protein